MQKALLLISLFLLIIPAGASAGNDDMIVLLKPTGNLIDGYPEMILVPDTSAEYLQVYDIIANSAVKEILEIYRISQVYMKNAGRTDIIQPAFLALTENQGGYAKKGFWILLNSGDTINHTQTQYVDIMLDRLLSEYAGLMSFTQLFPHELAHVIYSNISLNDSVDPEYRNVDMHYFPIITEYNIAFNEGFAEHMENISRIIETNTVIRTGIQKDLDRIEATASQNKRGYINDFKYPFRLGYYKSSIIYWFQKYEDYRRYTYAMDASIKFLYTSPPLRDIEDRLSIRNAGIMRTDKTRNIVQAMATEGLISAFFTKLIRSELPEVYLHPSFYLPFVEDTSVLSSPQDIFSPLENQFIKYFYVIHNHVSKWNTNTVQLVDFIEGYCQSFPMETEQIKRLYMEVSGRAYTNELPPQLWLMVKGHDHRMLAIDPFGAITMPVYTFDLNAAQEEDLLTMDGLPTNDINIILSHLENNGFFYDLDEIEQLDGISDKASYFLRYHSFDKEYFNTLEEPKLSFSAIIFTPIWKLVYKICAYLIFLILILNVFLLPRKKSTIRSRIWISIRYSLLWIALSILSLGIIVFIPNVLLSMLILLSGLIAFNVIIYFRRKEQLSRLLLMSLLMGLILIASII